MLRLIKSQSAGDNKTCHFKQVFSSERRRSHDKSKKKKKDSKRRKSVQEDKL